MCEIFEILRFMEVSDRENRRKIEERDGKHDREKDSVHGFARIWKYTVVVFNEVVAKSRCVV